MAIAAQTKRSRASRWVRGELIRLRKSLLDVFVASSFHGERFSRQFPEFSNIRPRDTLSSVNKAVSFDIKVAGAFATLFGISVAEHP